MRAVHLAVLVTLSLALAARSACAQELDDPMRPRRADVAKPQPEAASASGARASVDAIMIIGRRRAAIVDGKLVEVGDSIGASTVASISETEVVLKDEEGTTVLKRFPEIEKVSSAPKSKIGKLSGRQEKTR